MELIVKIAELLANLFGHKGESRSLVQFFELLILLLLFWIAAYLKPIAYHFAFVRDWIDYREEYAGHYVQIIGSGDDRRYSILDIAYRSYERGYQLQGFQYDTQGRRAIDFDSQNVAFGTEEKPFLEFVWKAETVADKKLFDGYTRMRPDDSDNHKMIEGRGFFITFDQAPRRFDLRFVKLTSSRLKQLELKDPEVESDREQFIKQFNKALDKHPELQPREETGSPIL